MSESPADLTDEQLLVRHDAVAREARNAEYGEDRRGMVDIQMELEREMRKRELET